MLKLDEAGLCGQTCRTKWRQVREVEGRGRMLDEADGLLEALTQVASLECFGSTTDMFAKWVVRGFLWGRGREGKLLL